jgi:hypothetical protein
MFRIHSARCGMPCNAFLPLVTLLFVTLSHCTGTLCHKQYFSLLTKYTPYSILLHPKRCTLYINSLLGTAKESHGTFICSEQYAMYSTKQFFMNNIFLSKECTAFLPTWNGTCHVQHYSYWKHPFKMYRILICRDDVLHTSLFSSCYCDTQHQHSITENLCPATINSVLQVTLCSISIL